MLRLITQLLPSRSARRAAGVVLSLVFVGVLALSPMTIVEPAMATAQRRAQWMVKALLDVVVDAANVPPETTPTTSTTAAP
jgi:hypothetical protein